VVADVVALVEDFDDELQAPAIMATALMKLANRTVDFRPLLLITKNSFPLRVNSRKITQAPWRDKAPAFTTCDRFAQGVYQAAVDSYRPGPDTPRIIWRRPRVSLGEGAGSTTLAA
jgi:hypothetical protein